MCLFHAQFGGVVSPLDAVHVRPSAPKLDLEAVRALPLHDDADEAVWAEARRVFAQRISEYWAAPTTRCPGTIAVDSEALPFFTASAPPGLSDLGTVAPSVRDVCDPASVLPVACAGLVGAGAPRTSVPETEIDACVFALGNFRLRTAA